MEKENKKKSTKKTTKKAVEKTTKKTAEKKTAAKTVKPEKKETKKTAASTKKKTVKETTKSAVKPVRKTKKKSVEEVLTDKPSKVDESFDADAYINSVISRYIPESRVFNNTNTVPVIKPSPKPVEPVIEEPKKIETPVVQPTVKQDKPAVEKEKKPNALPKIVISILAVIILGVGIYFGIHNSGSKKNASYHLSDLSTCTAETDLKVSIPDTWTLNSDGIAYITETEEAKMKIYVEEYPQDQFDELMISMSAEKIANPANLNDGVLYYIDNLREAENEADKVDYFLFYKNEVLNEFVFAGCDYDTEINIINSISE